ncbi:hypothetical protein [Ferrimonas marina]|nr:hypothetical protein [Ferrimonas marina]
MEYGKSTRVDESVRASLAPVMRLLDKTRYPYRLRKQRLEISLGFMLGKLRVTYNEELDSFDYKTQLPGAIYLMTMVLFQAFVSTTSYSSSGLHIVLTLGLVSSATLVLVGALMQESLAQQLRFALAKDPKADQDR